MASLNYLVKTNNEWNTIHLRFKQGSQFDYTRSTEIEIPKGRWSPSKKKVLESTQINAHEYNQKLDGLKAFIIEEYQKTKLEGLQIDSSWLDDKIKFFFGRETKDEEINQTLFIANYIGNYISKIRNQNTYKTKKNRTIQHYQTTKNKIEAFEKYSGNKVKFQNITLTFHFHFIEYLENEELLNPNTIGGYIDDIKFFCRNAELAGIEVPYFYKLTDFSSPSNETFDVYLNPDELITIFNHSFDDEHLETARDWLIIGCWTGLRISDLLKLSKEKHINDDFIEVVHEKTKYPAIIPIHEEVRQILSKRNGEFPRKMSDQKFNKHIKTVCELAGIKEKIRGSKMVEIEVEKEGKKTTVNRKRIGIYNKSELISSHTCRRSFATNLYGKIDTLTIMKIIGHKTEKQFFDYIKITPKEYAEKLRALWKNNPLT